MDEDDSGIMSSTGIPKRRKAACPQCSGCSAKSSRTANTRSASSSSHPHIRDPNSSGDGVGSDSGTSAASLQPVLPFTLTETINVLENMLAGEEDVVDLTCEGTEPAAVVDLTNNDSVVLVDEGPEGTEGGAAESYVVSSDEEEDVRSLLNAALLSSLQASSQARAIPGTISCPVCMDSYTEIVDTGRLVVSTKCGHVFCSQCIRDSLARSHTCPTCRKKLTPQQYHPIYI